VYGRRYIVSKLREPVPVGGLRQDVAAVLKRLETSREPLHHPRGRAAAVLLSIDACTRPERVRQLLQLLARCEREIARDKGASLDAVLAEADALLAAD
jgi:hypothetical protein